MNYGGYTGEDGVYHDNPFVDTIVYTEPDHCIWAGFDIIQRDVTVVASNTHDIYYLYNIEGHEALGHDYEETVIPPTYDTVGYTEHKCKRCGLTYNTDYVDMLKRVDDSS